MTTSIRRTLTLAAVSLVALLALGASTAGAHGGPGGGERLAHASSTSALVTQAAKQLGVTRAALVAAIDKSAIAAIDDAVADEDLDADRAADLKERCPTACGSRSR
jgi:hypothetical protein